MERTHNRRTAADIFVEAAIGAAFFLLAYAFLTLVLGA